jgi:4-diphosphocytidyl-2-C-methyl-D-erythritol kinase
VRCPAKVNLYLRVVGRRPDGYHDLVTVMQALTLADELTIIPEGGSGPAVRLECDRDDLGPTADNLVVRAARAFQEECGRDLKVRLVLDKRIPVAAGLGGGSSDAAGTLLALNEMAGGPLDYPGLHRLATRLGADVPFFLKRQPAVGRGTGTRLSDLPLRPYWYLLANPGVPLSTGWVYENLDLAGLAAAPTPEAWDPDHPETWLRNDLATVAMRRFPELARVLDALKQAGARCQGMSGSGPTVFGLYPTGEAARQAGQEIRRTFPGWLAVARGLTGPEPESTWEQHLWTIS